MQQVTENDSPKLPDIKRQLVNAAHELDDMVNATDPLHIADTRQALYSVREAIAHIEAAEKRAAQ